MPPASAHRAEPDSPERSGSMLVGRKRDAERNDGERVKDAATLSPVVGITRAGQRIARCRNCGDRARKGSHYCKPCLRKQVENA